MKYTLANSATGGLDALYLADGPWGVDYERNGADVTAFGTTPSSTQVDERGYALERSARMEGQVRTYASLFKSLRPGLLAQDLQPYRYLSFQASGFGRYEVIVTKESVHSTVEQFRYRFELDHELRTFSIPFAELTNRAGERQGAFTAEDVTSVVFNALGEGKQYESFGLQVEQLTFRKDPTFGIGTAEQLANNVTLYPNPAQDRLTVLVTQQPTGEVVKATLLDLAGRPLQTVGQGTAGANGQWQHDTNVTVPPGVYLLKVATSHTQRIIKFIKQ